MKVFYHADCLLHNPPYEILSGRFVPYLESPSRIECIKQVLMQHSATFELSDNVDEALDLERCILKVHDRDYIDYLKFAYTKWIDERGDEAAVIPEAFAHASLSANKPGNPEDLSAIARAGLYSFDLSSPITSDTYRSILAAIRVTLTAASWLLASDNVHQAAFALCRPPGHHSGPSLCGGYCFLNNVAVAARFIQSTISEDEGIDPPSIAILDIDYHHGNGSQDIFYSDPSVLYVSLHAENDYPYFTGTSAERGTGEGKGFNLNFPLPKGTTGDDKYCVTLLEALTHIRNFNPTYLIVSLGVDTYIDDPICQFKLTTPCYKRIGGMIASIRKPTLFAMEGGYHLDTIGANVCNVLTGFEQEGDF